MCSDVSLSTAQDTAGDTAPDCTDPDGDPMTYAIIDPASHGVASVAGDQLHYVPDTDYTGDDTFTYQANDGELDSNTAAVDVTVTTTPTNSAVEFDGTNDYVTFGAATTELGAAEFTLEAWIKWTGAGSETTTSAADGGGLQHAIPIVTKGRGEADNSNKDMNYFLGIDNATGKLAADFEEGSTGASPGQNHSIIGNTIVTTNVWHHVAATYDGTWTLYLDGSPDGTLDVNEPPRADSIQHAALGSALNSSGASAGYFAGVIDEARIWNVARTAGEIAASRDAELTGGTGLIGRWGLNDNTGTTAANSIVGSPAGTLTTARPGSTASCPRSTWPPCAWTELSRRQPTRRATWPRRAPTPTATR